ncbi:MAG: DUF1446 domain-containing protein [Proteobacteria bacterium]|nr:DUF1446 domain-containing protein [Pseudomonadota bacterium]
MSLKKVVRIGGACAFLGDSSTSAPQLLAGGDLDYMIFDYLAEVTMMILARVKSRRPDMGYARDFVDIVRDQIGEFAARGVKVITNAGGVNPSACRDVILEIAREAGVTLNVAVVEGDDLTGRLDELRNRGIREMYSGEPWPEHMMIANAYLGARPIAEALAMGADMVLTGRVVDSALTLGPLVHEFGWTDEDFDQLARGSLAGHIIECGAQATGGLFTDWESVPDWAHIGYPVIECHPDGTFVVTKPPETGGLVTPATVGEQLLYEIGDPQAYLLPDAACDFSEVRIESDGENRVRVTGARGRPPTETYKVCAGYHDGFRCVAVLPVIGIDAARKAERQAGAIIERTREMFQQRGFEDYRRVWIEPLGAEASYGGNSRTRLAREVACKIAVEHDRKEALLLFAREVYSPVTSMSPGSTGWFTARPEVSRVVKLFSFLIPKEEVGVRITLNGETREVRTRTGGGFDPASIERPPVPPPPRLEGRTVQVPLVKLAWGRSGDKGDSFNIGLIARKPEFLPYIRAGVSEGAVKDYMAHVFEGAEDPRVERFELPGFQALNFLFHESLGGGGMSSLRLDMLAKGMCQQLLDFMVPLPADFAARHGLAEGEN